jgi:hypothetical protein
MAGQLYRSGLETWSFLSGTTEGQHNVIVPNAGMFPKQSNLLTTVGVQITATQTNDILVLSSANWATKDLQEGDFLYINGTKREVLQIFPSKYAIRLKYVFGSAVTAQNVTVSKPSTYRYIKITAVGAADTATVDGVALKSGSSVLYDNNGGILPIVYSASGGSESLKFEVGI